MQQEKYGVLLVNLGTPAAPTKQAVRSYLAEFLSDSRVVDISRLIWWPILNGFVLPFRSPRVAKLYQSIWMEEGSPLMVYSRRQQEALQAKLPHVPVELAMSYGEPSLASAMARFDSIGIDHVILLPLYPQYSCASSAAVFDGFSQLMAMRRYVPSISYIRDYASHPTYIAALAQQIKAHFVKYGKPDMLLFSYHGIPKRYADEGDDYPQRCHLTTQAVVEALDLSPECYMMTFQSRFGREAWLTPYTDETVSHLPEKGIKHLQVICPGFAADCLETLEEIQVQNKDFFIEHGGETFSYIPALNDSEQHIELLYQLVCAKLSEQV